VLSVWQRGAAQHYIVKGGSTFFIDDGPRKTSLEELIEFYMKDPSAPTKLTTPVCRPGTSMPTNNPPPPADDLYMPPTSVAKAPVVQAPVKAQPPAFKSSTSTPKRNYQESPKYQDILKMQAEVKAIELPPRMPISGRNDSSGLANEWAVQFEMEAIATEKLNLWWLNKKLAEINEAPVTNVESSLEDATRIIKVLALVSGEKVPKYSKMARTPFQKKDNWCATVAFMKKLGIQVDDKGKLEEGEISVKLDALLLGELDRRELMKLFTKIMVYENKLIRKAQAATSG